VTSTIAILASTPTQFTYFQPRLYRRPKRRHLRFSAWECKASLPFPAGQALSTHDGQPQIQPLFTRGK